MGLTLFNRQQQQQWQNNNNSNAKTTTTAAMTKQQQQRQNNISNHSNAETLNENDDKSCIAKDIYAKNVSRYDPWQQPGDDLA